MPLKPIWNIVTTTTWVLHGTNIDKVLDVLEVTPLSLIQHVKSSLVHQLTHYFKSDLVAPLIHKGHRKIINEHGHHLALWWSKVLTDLEVTLGLDSGLEVRRKSG